MTTSFVFNLVPRDRLLPGLHGLRGIAAIAVVLFHLAHLTKIAPPPLFDFIGKDFGYGVHLFFILSAYSLMHSTEHTTHRANWCKAYYIKRFWRIAPLFYIVLLTTIVYMVLAGNRPSPHGVLLNLTLSFGAAPWTGIVMGGWSVGVEVLFYLIFPVLLVMQRSNQLMAGLLLTSILLSIAMRIALQSHYEQTVSLYGWNWSYFSFGSNICFFAMGLYSFHLTKILEAKNRPLPRAVPLMTLMLLALFLFTDADSALKGIARLDIIAWGIGFSGLCIWQSMTPGRWCANSFFEYIGERSYSIYLIHPLILIAFRKPFASMYATLGNYLGSYAFFICAALALLMIVVCSELSYRFIEVPGIRKGSRINRNIGSLSAA